MTAAGEKTIEEKGASWLILRTALLGKRTESIAQGVYCSEEAHPMSWSYGKDGSVEFDKRMMNEHGEMLHGDPYQIWRSSLNSDPALRVFHTPKFTEGDWIVGDLHDLSSSKWNELAIFVSPAFQANTAPVQLPNSQGEQTLRINLFCFGVGPTGACAIVVPKVDWVEVQAKLASFQKENLVLITHEPFIPGPTISIAPVDELAEILGQCGPVVYWNKISGVQDITEQSAAVISEYSCLSEASTQKHGPCGLVLPIENHTVLSCVPKYVIELVKRSAATHFQEGEFPRSPGLGILPAVEFDDERKLGSLLAYRLMYEDTVLPGQLPHCLGLDLHHFLNRYRPEHGHA